MSLKGMIAILVAFSGFTWFGYWRYQVGTRSLPVAQFGFIQDTSDSITNDCTRAEGFAKRAITMKETGPGSKIALFALGTRETANEPRFLGEFEIPVIRRVIEGQRAAARERDALLAKVRNQCERLRETKVSPVFQAVKRGVEHLQGTGKGYEPRYLFVQTDGEETENVQVKSALNSVPGKPSPLSGAINNAGVHVTFCGMAETIGDAPPEKGKPLHRSPIRDESRSDRLREVWTNVFTNPELVTFEPYCAR